MSELEMSKLRFGFPLQPQVPLAALGKPLNAVNKSLKWGYF